MFATIADPGVGYAVNDTVTIPNFENSGDVVLTIGSVGDTLGGIPVDAINDSIHQLSHYGIDSFCMTPDLSAYIFHTPMQLQSIGGGRMLT